MNRGERYAGFIRDGGDAAELFENVRDRFHAHELR